MYDEDLMDELMVDAREAVTLGAKFLDNVYPAWESKIDLKRLDLRDAMNCVLGQLYDGNYWGGWAKLRNEPEADGRVSSELGFDVSDDTPDAVWDFLDEAWADEVNRRV